MNTNTQAVRQAIGFLKKSPKSPKILVKQIRNLGDTLHLTPVIHHYRLKHPGAAIAFVVGQWYHNIHEHNPHIDGLFLADHNATPQQRLRLWPLIMGERGIDIKVIASIFPFGEVHKRNRWSHRNIADQYLHNSGITDLKPLGGRDLVVKITDDDRAFAKQIQNRHGAHRMVVLEYISYSKSPVWDMPKFRNLVALLDKKKIKCISIGAAHEPHIKGTIDCRGITWRQTTALLSVAKAMVGVGSGITMLAAAAEHRPRIIELGIADSVSMAGCGYAPSISISKPAVLEVLKKILEVT